MGAVRKYDAGIPIPSDLLAGRSLDRDKLAMVPRSEVAHAALLTLFQLQSREDPEEIVMGVTTAFVALCERTGMDGMELYNMGRRVLRAPAEGDHPTENSLQVLRDLVAGRVLGNVGSIG